MTRTITDPSAPVLVVSDAAVEAGARALDALWHTKSGYEVPADSWETADASWRESRLDETRAALTAALPHLTVPSATREDVETEWHVEVHSDGLIYDAEFDTEVNAREAWDDQPDGVLIRTEHTRWTHEAITPRTDR